MCNYVVLSYADNTLLGTLGPLQPYCDKLPFGHFRLAADYAMAARRAMHTQATGPETWKKIAMAQRKWANLNPQAIMHKRSMTEKDYDDSQWVVEPFRLFDCCLKNDGGRACVITSLERARDLKNPPAAILCPKCYSRETEWVLSSGKGTVYTFAVYRQAFHPSFENDIPYVTAIIALEDGPHFFSAIVGCEPEAVYCDMPVEIVWQDIRGGFSLPKFKPVSRAKE